MRRLQIWQPFTILLLSGESVTISLPPNSAFLGEPNSKAISSLQDFLTKEGGSVSKSKARCSIYDVTIDIDDLSLTLHSDFVNGLKAIDLANSDSEKEEVMKKFISQFGTHYSKQSIMGIGTEFETR